MARTISEPFSFRNSFSLHWSGRTLRFEIFRFLRLGGSFGTCVDWAHANKELILNDTTSPEYTRFALFI